jgi:hypothetical protein
MSIKTLLDPTELTIEKVTGRLTDVDDHDDTLPQADPNQLLLSGSKLYFTEKWLARMKKKCDGEGAPSYPRLEAVDDVAPVLHARSRIKHPTPRMEATTMTRIGA